MMPLATQEAAGCLPQPWLADADFPLEGVTWPDSCLQLRQPGSLLKGDLRVASASTTGISTWRKEIPKAAWEKEHFTLEHIRDAHSGRTPALIGFYPFLCFPPQAQNF